MSNPKGNIIVPEELRRDIELRVRISITEKDALWDYCEANNISVSDYVRIRVFGPLEEVKQRPTRRNVPFVC
jgi:hypothetical protein